MPSCAAGIQWKETMRLQTTAKTVSSWSAPASQCTSQGDHVRSACHGTNLRQPGVCHNGEQISGRKSISEVYQASGCPPRCLSAAMPPAPANVPSLARVATCDWAVLAGSTG